MSTWPCWKAQKETRPTQRRGNRPPSSHKSIFIDRALRVPRTIFFRTCIGFLDHMLDLGWARQNRHHPLNVKGRSADLAHSRTSTTPAGKKETPNRGLPRRVMKQALGETPWKAITVTADVHVPEIGRGRDARRDRHSGRPFFLVFKAEVRGADNVRPTSTPKTGAGGRVVPGRRENAGNHAGATRCLMAHKRSTISPKSCFARALRLLVRCRCGGRSIAPATKDGSAAGTKGHARQT